MRDVRLNRLLTLERSQVTADEAGGFTVIWQDLGKVWAEILPGAGRDVGGEEMTFSSVAFRIVMRGAPVGSPRRPSPGQRLRDGLRVFKVIAVTERDGDGHYLTCFAKEEELK